MKSDIEKEIDRVGEVVESIGRSAMRLAHTRTLKPLRFEEKALSTLDGRKATLTTFIDSDERVVMTTTSLDYDEAKFFVQAVNYMIACHDLQHLEALRREEAERE